MDTALRQFLARDDNLVFNLDVLSDNLKPIDQMIADGDISPWGGALLNQARLVYEYKHSTTLKMAYGTLELIRADFALAGERFTADLDTMDQGAAAYRNHPYCGLRGVIPEIRQIKNFSQVAYAGLIMYRKNLIKEDDKLDFDQYAVGGVIEHVDPDADARTVELVCESILLEGS